LCSDSQQTRGEGDRRLGRPARKLYEPRRGVLIAVAGAQDVAQEYALRLQRAADFSPGDDRLQLKSRLQALLRSLREDPGIDGRSDYVEFLVAWWSAPEQKPVALRLLTGGAVEWVEGWSFGGARLGIDIASFAVGTMRHLEPNRLSLRQAEVVALKVLRDTIETGIEGIAGNVQLSTVALGGVCHRTGAELRTLERAVDLWEARCAELLADEAGGLTGA
jgi:hypothetical protein